MRMLVIATMSMLLLTGQSQKPEELDKLLAPIALYPDQLLAQMLLCAGDPGQVVDLENWMKKNTSLKGTALQDEATAANFEPSFVALVLFPQVVHQLAADQAWTTKLGKAFAADRSGVFASIQRLRAKAQQAGKLKDTAQQDIQTVTTESGQQVIVIEPANPQVIYVPQYNPEIVYTTAPTTVVIEDDDDTEEAIAAGLIGFTAGIAMGAAMDNDYYYGPYGFHGGGFHMYNDAWDDYYDHREDAREDWVDHREDVMENRGDRSGTRQEQRTDRTQTRQGSQAVTQTQRTERTEARQENRPATQAATQASGTRASSAEARGYGAEKAQTAQQRSGTKSDAFSGYSSGNSTRAASSRGSTSRSSSGGGGGGGGARRGGGGRR